MRFEPERGLKRTRKRTKTVGCSKTGKQQKTVNKKAEPDPNGSRTASSTKAEEYGETQEVHHSALSPPETSAPLPPTPPHNTNPPARRPALTDEQRYLIKRAKNRRRLERRGLFGKKKKRKEPQSRVEIDSVEMDREEKDTEGKGDEGEFDINIYGDEETRRRFEGYFAGVRA